MHKSESSAAAPSLEPAPRVQVVGVSKTFHTGRGRHRTQVEALNDIHLDIPDGSITALTGLSGCGKSTLLRIIMGLETATEGHVQISGRRVTGCGYDRGLVFQHAELMPWRSALRNVEFGLELKGVPRQERRERALELITLVGLDHARDRRPDQLSGGMKQRAGLARALAVDPEVLLMDEPFGALDAQTRESLQSELVSIHLRTQKTIVIVTHDIDEAVLLADHVVVMEPHPGRIRTTVPIERGVARDDLAGFRATADFARLRQHLWELLMAPPRHTDRQEHAA